ncbi:MAG: hypothetical protein HOB63_05790, partial [Opitutae bacterium]|nr:hypothetical protein [Opitutae bacterium]
MKTKLTAFFLFLIFAVNTFADSSSLVVGDLNDDGEVNLVDMVLMVNHIQGEEFLIADKSKLLQADVNGDGLINSYDVEESLNFSFKRKAIRTLPLAGILSTSPYEGEGDVSLTREFVIRFSMPLEEGTVISRDSFYAESGSVRHVTSARLSSDRLKATLFLNNYRWPSNTKVKVTFDGNGYRDVLGRPIDPDGDGQGGGIAYRVFSSIGVSGSDSHTSVEGWVYDSDNSKGDTPLAGALITVIGNEEQMNVLTGADGYFKLSPAPSGRFFVNVDGRLIGAPPEEKATDGKWRDRDYYPIVGKAWESVPGDTVPATRYGVYDENGTYKPDPKDGKIYLPKVMKGALQTVDANAKTKIALAPGYLEKSTAEQRALLEATSITIPPGSLQADDGTTGGSVGIAPVASDRLPEPLPESLKMPLVITVQTDGASNFDVPVPARFPNVDGLPPGTKSALWSFDHDTGKWEIAGPMTVSEDGKYLETDPGVGIRQPGWHGSSPGAEVFGKAVISGPSVKKLKPGTCGISHSSMAVTENQFTSLANLSEGIEETTFGSNDDDLGYANKVLGSGTAYASAQAPKASDWETFSQNAEADTLLHAKLARDATALFGGETPCWPAFSSAATTIRDTAIKAASGKSGASQRITQAHSDFTSALERARNSITPQMEAWEKYATATTALGRQVKGIAGKNDFTGDKAALAKVIKEVRDAHRSLPGGRKRLDKQIKDFAKAWQSFLEGSLKGKLDEYKGESFVFIKRMGSEREEGRDPPIAAQRIKVGPGGSYSAIVRPNSYYEAWMLEPTHLIIGSVCFVSPRNGGNKQVPPIPLCADDGPDTDFDYLSDRGERIVGTNKDQPDTDGDGVPDGFEILNGTDPSGGNPVFTGILATAPASGGFSDFVTTEDDLAILGNGPAGIDLFDIGSGVRPIKISSIDTPGSVRKAALAGNYIAVADGSAGLTVVDLTSRESPSVSWKIPLGSPANAIATAGNVAFVGLENGKIVSYDLFSGQQIDALHLGGTIEDLTTGENLLFALENVGSQRSRIHSIPTRNGRFSDDD